MKTADLQSSVSDHGAFQLEGPPRTAETVSWEDGPG